MPEPHAIPCGVAVLDTAVALESFDFSPARRWHAVVLDHGTPVLQLETWSPGALDSPGLARLLFLDHARYAAWRTALIGELEQRLGAHPPLSPPHLSRSVVVCTHRRPRSVRELLGALGRLDPAPDEIVVVDNDPGEADCRAEVEAAGARYVCEPRRGLDNARNAGVTAARGEIVVFCDDDCLPSPGWLRAIDENFAHPLVGAATGPVFPYRLDTAAQVRMERQASLGRGLRRRSYDLTSVSPLNAGRAGAGANMAFRRSLLAAVDRPFPPELDAGTETESGGDTYVLGKVVAAGYRIVYEPRQFLFHQHRADSASMHRAILGYGKGVASVLVKLALEERRLEAPLAAKWLVQQYLETQRRRLRGSADGVATRLAWEYVRGAIEGPAAWRRALASQRRLGPLSAAYELPRPPRPPAPPDPPLPPAAGVDVSVVIPTFRRSAALDRSLCALAGQRLDPARFEVIVVDDSPEGTVAHDARRYGSLRWSVLRSAGTGAAAARNAGARAARGRLLLFLDDDLIAAPGLLAHHLAAHAAGPRAMVVGYSPPEPRRPNLAERAVALWWEDHFASLRELLSPTLTSVLSGNMSIALEDFQALGGFDPGFARFRREDWDFGARVLLAGLGLRYRPEAIAGHEYTLAAADRVRASELEGHGDSILAERHPEATVALPVPRAGRNGPVRVARTAALRVATTPPFLNAAIASLGPLERMKLSRVWSAVYDRSQRVAYRRGLRAGGFRPRPGAIARQTLELAADTPIPPPRLAPPLLDVCLEGRPLVSVTAPDGHWHARIAEAVADALTDEMWPELAALKGWAEPTAGAPELEGLAVVVADRAADEALRRHGAELLPVPASADRWAEVADRLAGIGSEIIAIPVTGVAPGADWLAQALEAFAAPELDVLVGRILPSGAPPSALSVYRDWPARHAYAPPQGGADFMLVRGGAYGRIGDAAAELAGLGDQAVVAVLHHVALRHGLLVGQRDVAGAAGRWARDRPAELHAAWGSALAARFLGLPGGARASLALVYGLPAAALAARRLARRAREPRKALAAGSQFARGAGRAATSGARLRQPAPQSTRQRWGGRKTPASGDAPVTLKG